MSLISPTLGRAGSFAALTVTAWPFDMTVKVLALSLTCVTLPVILR